MAILNWPSVFGRPVENAEKAKRAVARPLRARQETTASATGSAESTGGSSSETAGASETGAAASSTDASETATDASVTSAASAESAEATAGSDTASQLHTGLTTDASGDRIVITRLIKEPPWTATSASAYLAPGFNTTRPTTTSLQGHWPGLEHSTSSHSTSTTSAAWAWATEFGVPHNVLTKCTIDGKNTTWGPFCTPNHDQNLWVGYRYAFTWNPDLFPLDASNHIQLEYNDKSLGNASVGAEVPAWEGHYEFDVTEDWLHGAAGNNSDSGQNITVIMISDPGGDAAENITPGPQICITKDPKTLPRVRIKNLPAKYGLEIGLPIGLVGLLIIFLSFCCAFKKGRRHYVGATGAGKDYMARRARKRGRKGGDIQLDDMDIGREEAGPRYTDQPVTGGGNVFREEVKRQREEDDMAKRNVTSF